MEREFSEKMRLGLEKLGMELSENQLNQFYQYYQLLIEWNQVMNLTAITEMGEVVSKHFLDSLSLIRAVPDFGRHEDRVIDVGTGAGFPGIPLKIAFPSLKITLLDSLNKRIRFLETVLKELKLQEIGAVHGRAEDFGRRKEYREQFDFCLSRAVANTASLAEYCIPFVKVGGIFISYKSGKIDEELKQGERAIQELGGKVEQVIRFSLSDGSGDRSLVMIRKTKNTEKRYPRKAGMPTKEPIGR